MYNRAEVIQSGQVDRSFLRRVISPGLAARIDYAEHHHGDYEPLLQLAGLVRSIRVASCRYELEEGGGSGPAAGSGRLQDVSSTDDEPASIDGEGRPGWVVEVRPVSVQ